MLIVVLTLPFRGAMAVVGAFCHMGSSSPASGMQLHHDMGNDGLHDSAGASSVDASHHGTDGAADDPQPGPLSDTCAYCSASCGAPPLIPAVVSLTAPLPSGAERFPALPVPRVRSVADGPERPPRTI